MNTSNKILIVGAGIAGLASYLALKNKGIAADIIETHPCLKKGTGGLLLTSNAIDTTKQLGIYSKLKSSAFEVKNIHYRNEKNQPLMIFSREKHFPDSAEFFTLHRNLLLQSLAELVPDGKIMFNQKIKAMAQQGNKTKVTFKNGESKDYDLVIAADGIHSQVRTEMFDQHHFTESKLSCIRLVMPKPKQLNEATYLLGKGRAAALLPIDDNKMYCPFVFSDSLINKPQGAAMALEDAVVLAECLEDNLLNNTSISIALAQYQKRRFERVNSVQIAGEKRVKAMQLSQSTIGQAIVQNIMKINGESRFKKDWAELILTPA